MKIKSLITIFLLTLIFLSTTQSCGRKGPLKLPEEIQKQKDIEDAKDNAEL